MSQNKELIISLATLQSHLLKKIDQNLSVHGISFSEFLVLHHLQAAPHMTMRRIDLAECVGLSASGITRLVNPMQKNHLVEKEVNARDARVSLVRLSETGEELYSYAMVSFEHCSDDLLKPLSNKQVTSLLKLTTRLL
jgi:DNA-binding MarR family transcriptional regulator